MTSAKPLMLKDYLELDESSSVGFQCYPRRLPHTSMRNLLEAELRGSHTLARSPSSKSTFQRLFTKFLFSQKQEGFLSRSLSKKLKGSFWKRRFGLQGFDQEEMERKSFDYPSPVVSSFRSWLDQMDDGLGFGFRSGSEFLTAETPARNEMVRCDDDDDKQEHQKVEERESMDRRLDIEKEQLSPVSVMDFPYDEEEDDDVASATTSSSPSYQFRSITNNSDRSNLQIPPKSRRFDEINLSPTNLNDQFTASESDTQFTSTEEKLLDLLEQLGSESIFQNLLEDFFCDALSQNKDTTELLNEANEWINNEVWIWEMQGRKGEMEVKEMERIGKWRGFEEERMGVSSDLGDLVFESLIEELINEIII